MHPTAQPLLDRDVAIIIVTAPVWISAFCVLAALGAWNGRKDRRARG